MSAEEQQAFLKNDLIVEEKLDGANIGISRAPNGKLRVQNRGSYLAAPYRGQFSRLPSWLAMNSDRLQEVLPKKVILFGEWCAAKHSIEYSSLPDLFLLFDVYDLKEKRFWSVLRRNVLASSAGLQTVPKVDIEDASLIKLIECLELKQSKYSNERLEGFVLRNDSHSWNIGRAKLVRHDFTQSIEEHWSKKHLTWNRLAGS
ncbi:RNA ligase family protein [Pseudophaeobacter leonis]|uniref:RNA ligase family protein n=1 Tax=Pseudophaeobacter leonis TaxID=1144477 RepID=UPI0019D34255|nr:RNA ligase family protein [Pseudophaeobacter leonis]